MGLLFFGEFGLLASEFAVGFRYGHAFAGPGRMTSASNSATMPRTLNSSLPTGSIVISWLVPLFPTEAALVSMHGWPALEDLLVQFDRDLTDWRRLALPEHNG